MHVHSVTHGDRNDTRSSLTEPRLVRWLLTGIALAFLVLFILLPLLSVFTEALRKGWDTYLSALREPDAIAGEHCKLLVRIGS